MLFFADSSKGVLHLDSNILQVLKIDHVIQ